MNRETLFLIALELDFPDILNYCKTSKVINEAICKRESFWITKLRKDFEFPIPNSPENAKEYYKILYLIRTNNPDYYARAAFRKGWKDLAKFIVKKELFFTWSFLSEEAAIQNDMEMINFLFQYSKGFSFSVRGAAKTGNIELIKYFLDERDKYEDEIKNSSIYIPSKNYVITTSLIGTVFAREKAKETFDYLFRLLSDEAKGWAKHDHYGVLSEAARLGREDLIEYFISVGFDNWNGGLEGAARSKQANSVKLVRFFIQKGANLKQLEQPLYIATYMAKKRKLDTSYKIIKILAQHGAFNQANSHNKNNAYDQALEEAEGDGKLVSFLKKLARKYKN
jgi:hypothetical protein